LQRRAFFRAEYISNRYTPHMRRSPKPPPPRNTTTLRHKNSPEPHQDPRLTPLAGTTLQGRDPHNTITACQRGNNRLHSRGRGCRMVDHIIATSPTMLSRGLSCAHKEGRQTSTCHDTIARFPYPPFVKDPVGGHRFHMWHIHASPTTTSRLRHNGTLEGIEQTHIRVWGSQTHFRVETLHPQLIARECVSRRIQPVDVG
jgi:hypothetical protein